MDGRDHGQRPLDGSGSRFDLDVIPDRERVIVAPTGEVDVATAPRLLQAIDELLESGFEQVVVDLRRVELFGSQGIRALVLADDRARALGARLSIHPGTVMTRRALEICGLLPHLDVTRAVPCRPAAPRPSSPRG